MVKSQSVILDSVIPGALLFAGVGVPIVMASLAEQWTVGLVLLLINTTYAGIRLVFVIFRGRARILQLFFWTFGWVFLGLAPLSQQVANDWPWPGGVGDDGLWQASLVVFLSYVAYDVGHVIGTRKDTAILRPPTRTLSVRRLKFASAFAVVACVSQIIAVGPGVILSGRAARAAASTSTSSGAIQSALMVSVVFVVAYLFVRAKRGKALQGWMLTTILLVALTLFVTNPISSARYRVASVVAALVLALIWPASRRQMALLGGGLILGLGFLFPLLNLFRKDSVTTADNGVLEYLRQGDFDAFQQVANTLLFVQDRGFTFGGQGLGSVLFFIPRSIWPQKAIDTGVMVADSRGYNFTNLSAPLQAEAYVDGGLPLVIVVFGLLGFATAYAERRAAGADRLLSFTGLFVPIIAAYQFIMLRGSLLQSMAGFAVVVLVTWLCTEPANRAVDRSRPGPSSTTSSRAVTTRLR